MIKQTLVNLISQIREEFGSCRALWDIEHGNEKHKFFQRITAYAAKGKIFYLFQWSTMEGELDGFDVLVPVSEENNVEATKEALIAFLEE